MIRSLILLIVTASSLHAQISIDSDDFAGINSDTLNYINCETFDVNVPPGLTDYYWDYSKELVLRYVFFQYPKRNEGSPEFPESDFSENAYEDLRLYFVRVKNHYKLDEGRLELLGKSMNKQTFPFDFPEDEFVEINEQTVVISPPLPEMIFPLEFTGEPVEFISKWKIEGVFHSPSLGYDSSEVAIEIEQIKIIEVIGWGDLKIPNTKEWPVLLVEYSDTLTFKYYLDGELAPESLLFLVGLSQSEKIATGKYEFRTKNLWGPLLAFEVDELGQLSDVYYYLENPATEVEDELEPQISIYPNPSNDYITISGMQESNNLLIEINDLRGRKLCSKVVTGVEATISLSDIAAGVYIVKVLDEGKVQTLQLMKTD